MDIFGTQKIFRRPSPVTFECAPTYIFDSDFVFKIIYSGKRWLDEGGIKGYMQYCSHWITKVNTFIKFHKIRQNDVDEAEEETPVSLSSYLQDYLQHIPEFSDDYLRKKGEYVFFRQDIFTKMKVWPRLKTMFLETKNASINRNLRITGSQLKRFCSLPWNILPSEITDKFDLPVINQEDIIDVLDLHMSTTLK